MPSSRGSSWPGDLPDPRIWPTSLMSAALTGRFFTTRAMWEALSYIIYMHTHTHTHTHRASLVAQTVKNLPAKKKKKKESACNEGDLGSIPGSGRSPGEGNGNPLQYSCLENPMDREAWWATIHGVTKSRTRLSNFTLYTHILFHYDLAQVIEYGSLCSTVGPYCLPILCI